MGAAQASDEQLPSLEMLLFISDFSEDETWRDPFEIQQAISQARIQTNTPQETNEKKDNENSTDTAH